MDRIVVVYAPFIIFVYNFLNSLKTYLVIQHHAFLETLNDPRTFYVSLFVYN